MFRGALKADRIVMNGAELTEIRSVVHYENGIVDMDHTGFRQGTEGSVTARLRYDMQTQALRGTMDMEKFDVGALLALANQKEDRITGQITSRAVFAGTRDNPSVALTGASSAGTVAGYPVTDVALEISYADHALMIKTLAGKQGSGTFSAAGTADFHGVRYCARHVHGTCGHLRRGDGNGIGCGAHWRHDAKPRAGYEPHGGERRHSRRVL